MKKTNKQIISEIEDLLKQIKNNESKTYEIGEKLRFKNLDWLVINDNGNIVELLTKNVLSKELIKKYSDDDFMINDSNVRHTDTIRPISWEESYIYKTMLPNLKKDLGIDCKVTLLSKKEVMDLPLEIRKCNDWYWTKPPIKNGSLVSSSTHFSVVNDYGYSNTHDASVALGLRPKLIIKKEILEEKE